MFSAVGVIPARYGSSRLPGKPLAELQGRPLLYHVFRRASRAARIQKILIATDDVRIAEAARGFGAEVVMTGTEHRSGTDRIAEAVSEMQVDVVVNIQGDEPLIDATIIDHAVEMLENDPSADMSTLKSPIHDLKDLLDPNVVKVVTDERGYAMYFSRSPIPYTRAKDRPRADLSQIVSEKPELLSSFYRHLGLYGYRREFLMQFTQWAPSVLERLEDLEQLRALEHGAKIRVGISHAPMIGIDTPEDLERIRKAVKENPEILLV